MYVTLGNWVRRILCRLVGDNKYDRVCLSIPYWQVLVTMVPVALFASYIVPVLGIYTCYTYTWLTSPVDVIIVLGVAYTMTYQSRLLCLFLARKRQVAKVKLAKIKLAI